MTHLKGSSAEAFRRVIGAVTGMFLVFSLMMPVVAQDDDLEIVIPLPTVIRASQGAEIPLSMTQTAEAFVGETCGVSARAENQSSVHPGNDLVIESGGGEIILHDVEAQPGGVVTATGTLVLGETIVITLVMGADEVFSAGIEVRFQCPPTEVTTTTEATTTTVSATTITAEATTTSEAPTTSSGPATTEPTSTTVRDEVSRTTITQELPFTGRRQEELGLFALAVGVAGVMLLIAARSKEPATLTFSFTWNPLCAWCGRDVQYLTPYGGLCETHTRRALDEAQQLWVPMRIGSSSTHA